VCSTGRYRLEAVPPGRYYVVAGRVTNPTFYPGVTVKTEAKAISVTKGSDISGIDFTVANTSTQSSSPFGESPFVSLQQFVSLAPQVQLHGHVVLDESSQGQPLPDRITITVRSESVALQIYNLGVQGFSFQSINNSSARTSVAADGTFAFSAPEGDARITVANLPQGYTLKAITAGGNDITNSTVSTKGAPEIVVTIHADLRQRFTLSGHVVADHDPFGEAIELVGLIGTTTRILLESGGAFTFTNLLPGNYIVNFPGGKIQRPVQITSDSVDIELRP